MLNSEKIRLIHIEPCNRRRYLKYLLLADESEAIVNSYINDGDMFLIQIDEEDAGVMLFVYHTSNLLELKNFSLDLHYRGKGVGKMVLEHACKQYRRSGIKKMIVGTANSSIGNLAFYQKVGFRMTEIKKDVFLNYPEPIVEDGIRALDMVMFEKVL